MAKRESEKDSDSAATVAWDRFTQVLVSRGEGGAAALKELRSQVVGQHELILDLVLTLERSDLEQRSRELEMLQALRSDAMLAVDRASQLGREKEQLQSKLSDLEETLQSLRQERAGAEERWSASDDQRQSLIRTLHKTVEELDLRLKGAGQERDELAAALKTERESLELAWKEATNQREALAATRAEFKERVDVLERQQEEFLAHLVDEYDAQLATAREELEALRARKADVDDLSRAQQERDDALQDIAQLRQDLDEARAAQQAMVSLRVELESLREGTADRAKDELTRLRDDLAQARAGMEQLLRDCDRLSAENVRLREQIEAREPAADAHPIPFDLDESIDTNDALALAQARELVTPVRSGRRKSSGKMSPALARGKSARPPATSPPAARRGPSEDPGRTVGSYSLIGGELGDEAVGSKPKSKTV